MSVVVIEDLQTLAEHAPALRRFIDEVKPRYSSHVLDALVQWYASFSCEEGSFASRRGMNFFGRDSALRSLFFLLVRQGEELIAFAPFFRFEVDLGGEAASRCQVVSFCPDSTIFFYSDLLVKRGLEQPALQAVYDFFTEYERSVPFILLFNHLPSNSRTLPLLTEYSMGLPPHGFNLRVSPLFWRGGLYPWNVAALKEALGKAQGAEFAEETAERIREALERVESASKTMLVFKKNHLPLKAAVYRIFQEAKPSAGLFDLYNSLEAIFQSSPVKYPFLPLPESREELEDSFSSSKRYYFKRYRRQFFEQGGSFRKIAAKAIDEQDIRDFLSLHRERWGNRSNILNGLTSSFLLSFLGKLAANGHLTLFFALQGGERIAALCCLDFNGRREFLSSGRSLQAEKSRAGKLLLHDAIMDSIDNGFRQFDFGYGDEAYKSDYNWTYLTNNVIALFRNIDPKHCHNILSLYEEVII